jgi:hypothetical protein
MFKEKYGISTLQGRLGRRRTRSTSTCAAARCTSISSTVDLYINGTRGWSAAEADTRN